MRIFLPNFPDYLFHFTGFAVKTLAIDGYEFISWDVGGRNQIRPLWRHYYPGTEALIFVVDSSDMDRFDQARDEFHRVLGEEILQRDLKAVLLYCNKQDLPNALPLEEIQARLCLDVTKTRYKKLKWVIAGCCATSGEGLQEGLAMLTEALNIHGKEEAVEDDDEIKSLATISTESSSSSSSSSSSWEITKSVERDFDPAVGNGTLGRFFPIKSRTECPYAKAANIWGGNPGVVDSQTSLEDQAKANLAALEEFTTRSNQGEKLDGYCIELDSLQARNYGPVQLGESVRVLLTALADGDPSGENMMRVNYIGSRGWRFRFNRTDFFVTTFAPCYPKSSSRYGFGSERAFLLLQPEQSFSRHDLPRDTPHTNWENPKTMRDKTRVAFHKAGRLYHIPSTIKYPMAEHIVKPVQDDGMCPMRWWEGDGI
jgi:signal recognition particle receptor subunit beta